MWKLESRCGHCVSLTESHAPADRRITSCVSSYTDSGLGVVLKLFTGTLRSCLNTEVAMASTMHRK